MKKLTLFIAMLFCAAFNYSAQAIESHTVACTAGNLAIVTAGYKATVTNLTVTGTIDARDFKTMQSAMPLLDTIDLSGSTVEAYLGAQGTNGTTFTDYPANAIPPFAFHNLSTHASKTSLKSFVYPSSITTIGVYAFLGCSGFTGSLIIPSSVTTIGECAFIDCSGFTGSLSIPSSVTTIGGSAFYACSGLTGSLTIPSSVTTIGSYAFHSCSGFTSIIALSTTPINIVGSSDVFYNINKTTCILNVPVGSKSLYAAADQWKNFINIEDGTITSVNEVSTNSITIFPNPAISYITVSDLSSLVNDKTVTLSVTNVSGSTLFTQDVEFSINTLTLDVSSFKSGIYFIAIQTSNGKVVKRFVKE